MLESETSASTPLQRRHIITKDGSSSLEVIGMDETYHSSGGALTESKFIFIEHGLKLMPQNELAILEIGMGTGLNVLLTLIESEFKSIDYHTLEPFPLITEEYELLNYAELLGVDPNMLSEIHECPMGIKRQINPHFALTKYELLLQNFTTKLKFDLVYFDAFAPGKQASPWEFSNLEKVYNCINSGGLLITYCAQGQFKRNLKQLGFEVSNPRGPMGKWEITLAWKANGK